MRFDPGEADQVDCGEADHVAAEEKQARRIFDALKVNDTAAYESLVPAEQQDLAMLHFTVARHESAKAYEWAGAEFAGVDLRPYPDRLHVRAGGRLYAFEFKVPELRFLGVVD